MQRLLVECLVVPWRLPWSAQAQLNCVHRCEGWFTIMISWKLPTTCWYHTQVARCFIDRRPLFVFCMPRRLPQLKRGWCSGHQATSCVFKSFSLLSPVWICNSQSYGRTHASCWVWCHFNKLCTPSGRSTRSTSGLRGNLKLRYIKFLYRYDYYTI